MRPWILRPHNYSQVIPRNYYNVAYRNTGVYKGMGQYPCVDNPALQCSVQGGSSTDTVPQSMINADPYFMTPSSTATTSVPTSVPTWVWAAAGVLLVLMVAKR